MPQLCLLIWSKHMHASARAILNQGGRGALQSKKQEADASAKEGSAGFKVFSTQSTNDVLEL